MLTARKPTVSTNKSLEITSLLQKGIAAARSGRYIEARHQLEQVVQAAPSNEMAWLWLSSLMSSIQQKRACLEQVLQANPDNSYARAGLARLEATPRDESALLEAGLTPVTPG
jgi:Tfp pilus assembly protein PilF